MRHPVDRLTRHEPPARRPDRPWRPTGAIGDPDFALEKLREFLGGWCFSEGLGLAGAVELHGCCSVSREHIISLRWVAAGV